ncbi:acetyltransferase [uncultured Hymenobacter sp.]|uniref:acetyltransferase n=1 Tax=uncultured Hymenobacter sp. TaxID=170016 RepID=UPI0035C9A870
MSPLPTPPSPANTAAPSPPAPAAARPRLAIFGAGGLGREVLALAHQLNEAAPTWELFGFFDDQPPAAPARLGLPYRGTSTDLLALGRAANLPTPLHVAIAVGNGRHRAAVAERLRAAGPELCFPSLVHPGVACQPYQRLQIGQGCLIQQGCILTTDVTLGDFVLLNLGCTVGHDARLDDFCSLMPHANVGGGAHLSAGVYLGTNATVIQGVRVGARTIVGAGAVAVRDLPADVTAVGVPAKAIMSYKL